MVCQWAAGATKERVTVDDQKVNMIEVYQITYTRAHKGMYVHTGYGGIVNNSGFIARRLVRVRMVRCRVS